MSTLQHADSSGNPAGRYATIDTIEAFSRKRPSREFGLIREIQNYRGVILRKCRDRRGELCGWRLIVHQPELRTFLVFECLQAMYRAPLCRLDVAFDRIVPDADADKEQLARKLRLRWRPLGQMHDEDETTYFTRQLERTRDGKKRRSRRDLVMYADRPSKVTGEVNCNHIELRFYGAESVRCSGFASVRSLQKLNPRKLFKKHIRLSANFDAEPIIKKVVRAAVNDDRNRKSVRGWNAFEDKYRAAIPRRVRAFLERITQNRIQRWHDLYKVKAKPISLDVLGVPETITIDDNRRGTRMFEKYMCDFNETMSRIKSATPSKSHGEIDGYVSSTQQS